MRGRVVKKKERKGSGSMVRALFWENCSLVQIQLKMINMRSSTCRIETRLTQLKGNVMGMMRLTRCTPVITKT